MLDFKEDTFKIIKMTKAPIVPSRFTKAYKILNKEEKMTRKDIVKLEYLKPIEYKEYKDLSTAELSALVRKRIEV
jgi:1-acyl-sn-glycerol-3-phosphate acyltransferase